MPKNVVHKGRVGGGGGVQEAEEQSRTMQVCKVTTLSKLPFVALFTLTLACN